MLLTKNPVKEFATGHTELICSVQPLWFIVGALMQLWELGMPFNRLLLQVLQSWVKEILNVALNFLLPGLKMKHFAPFRKCPSIFHPWWSIASSLRLSVSDRNLGIVRNLESSVCSYLCCKSPCHIHQIYSYIFPEYLILE